MSLRLRKLGLNDLLLKDLIRITQYNPEQDCIIDEDTREYPVSLEVCKRSKYPKKMFNALKNLRIYNITHVATTPNNYNFVCKESFGRCLNVSVGKTQVPSYKIALITALEQLKDIISTLPPRSKFNQEIYEKNQEALKSLEGIDLNLPDGLELTPEMIQSIQGVLEDVKNKQVSDVDIEDGVFEEI